MSKKKITLRVLSVLFPFVLCSLVERVWDRGGVGCCSIVTYHRRNRILASPLCIIQTQPIPGGFVQKKSGNKRSKMLRET